jgi:cytosine/adenosine deaminase-related metal-dependent hydrolase
VECSSTVSPRLVIRNGLVAGPSAPGPATVVVEDGLVVEVAPEGQAVAPRPGDWDVDAAGRLVVPGAVDPHTHLALGALARLSGLPGQAPAEHGRWRAALRSALEPRADAEAIEALTAAGAAAALRAGITCAFDLVRGAPGHAPSTLAAAGRALDALGLRAVLAHGACDAAGPGCGLEEVAASAAFAAAHEAGGVGRGLVRGAAGLEGLDAVSDELLAALGPVAARHGLLASVGEDETDLTAAYFRWSLRPAELLQASGLLGPRTILAHGATLSAEEGHRLAAAGAALAATPRAAAFWGSTTPAVAELAADGVEVVLGTDGLFPDTAGELVAIALFARSRARSPRAAPALTGERLWPGAARLAGRFFGGTFGVIAPGAVADLVVLEWRPAVPPPDVPLGDLAMLWAGAPAAWTIVGGEVRLREGRLLGIDEPTVAVRARAAAARLLG